MLLINELIITIYHDELELFLGRKYIMLGRTKTKIITNLFENKKTYNENNRDTTLDECVTIKVEKD